MIVAKYIKDARHDANLSWLINTVKNNIKQRDDDFMLLCVGDPGTGKSHLALYALEEYLGDEASVAFIGLNKGDFANALRAAKECKDLRFCLNDEANLSKRDALSMYNKHTIDLYYSIRGLNIWHWWNNPSLDMIDKAFIKERIKGVIIITTKSTDRPRIYYYLTKKAIMQILEKYGSLDIPLLKKVVKKYALFKGWFKEYNGPLLKPYLMKKGQRMDEKIEEFAELYGSSADKMSIADISKVLGISKRTIERYELELTSTGKLKLDRDITITATGRRLYTRECVHIFQELGKAKLIAKRHNMEQVNEKIKAKMAN